MSNMVYPLRLYVKLNIIDFRVFSTTHRIHGTSGLSCGTTKTICYSFLIWSLLILLICSFVALQ